MSDESKHHPKHLARNVPLDFGAVCERVRHREFTSRTGKGRSAYETYQRVYGAMLEVVASENPNLSEHAVCRIGEQLDEVLVRFLAVQKTLDQSVPTKPVFSALAQLNKATLKTIERLHDADRNATNEYVANQDQKISLDGVFDGTNSLSEKVQFAELYLKSVAADLQKMVDFFDYKNGLAVRGNPSKFALVYAVFALAALFEAEGAGARAIVNETVNDGRNGRPNARRYTGSFLRLVHAFLQVASIDMLQRGSIDGLNDRVRKLAQSRKSDPKLYLLLHKENVSPENVLEFMKRAEQVK